MLGQDTITIGKYKGKTLDIMLKDRKYCKWILDQEWFKTSYEYLYNKIQSYEPLVFFIQKYQGESNDFIDTYDFFNLKKSNELSIELTEDEKKCYEFYLEIMSLLKTKIIDKIGTENQYDIKAPTKWLQTFEEKTSLSRDVFKQFISSYDLPNITDIIERIKKEGGIEYKGAKGFSIAKSRSAQQEQFWENLLKNKYGENIGTQFKYESCIFDFICIPTNTIYECKLGLKDFNDEQYNKYKITLDKYSVIYLISTDCIININEKKIYTLDPDKYRLHIALSSEKTFLDKIILDFEIFKVNNIENFI